MIIVPRIKSKILNLIWDRDFETLTQIFKILKPLGIDHPHLEFEMIKYLHLPANRTNMFYLLKNKNSQNFRHIYNSNPLLQ